MISTPAPPYPQNALFEKWYLDAVFYEVHVKSFFDSNDDGIGDFNGLRLKLDYLSKLGIDCVWLLPFYPSPLKDDGYDISNFYAVHPDYGTLEDFENFVNEAHGKRIRVIADLVMNHVSDMHSWFQEARSSPISPKRNWFVWSDTDSKYKDARIIFLDTERSNWSWDTSAKMYYWHRFYAHQPDLNYDSPEVREEMKSVMRFWLKKGLDGFRCDAVPYLFKRDGTNCENLPETHQFFKDVRRMIDEEFPGKILLAEANQWVEDVIPYFGKGDEFHIAFNFPLMPRIFIALARENNQPIIDIVNQTTGIPPTCSWGTFLRNHDELTLEMVTNEDRDFMYHEYAKSLKMRLNLGIRRRLATLLENNRTKMELIFALLFTLPGSPVIYYGDEIGMGDNIYLGDRNGVRTPMQWSADRNAGFSRCDPEQLYSQIILNPIYHYEAVNVDAQERFESSLLQMVRKMIRTRKKYIAFGRGSIEFMQTINPKVLAFTRQYGEELLLTLFNLSHNAQPVELELKKYNGMRPVEIIGQTPFPKIGELPYFLTLTPHGYLWFKLERQKE